MTTSPASRRGETRAGRSRSRLRSTSFVQARLIAILFAVTSIAAAPTVAFDETQPSRPVVPLLPEDGAGLLERIQSAFATLIERVGPAVVAIQADRHPANLGEFEGWSPRPWISTGSGVIIRDDGRILTSQHVIEGAVAIHVILHDGRRRPAQLIAADRRSDLAILRIHADDLQVAELADSGRIRRGHIVLALGNPLGLSSDGQAAVSHGLISAIGRPLPETFGREEDRYYGDMIQTTAPINPGNSGGPLVDVHGRVIGIIAAVSTHADGREGIGFAVPINEHTKAIIDKLLRGQSVEYGYLGVTVDRVPEDLRQSARIPPGLGVLIHSVEAGGPAERGGLRDGDVVLALDGKSIGTVEEFVRKIGSAGPEREVRVDYVRNTQRRSGLFKLVRRASGTPPKLPEASVSFRGAALATVRPVMQTLANLPENTLLVLRVDAGSPADRAGLAPGDIIVRIEGKPLSRQAVTGLAESRNDLLIGLANGGSLLVKAE